MPGAAVIIWPNFLDTYFLNKLKIIFLLFFLGSISVVSISDLLTASKGRVLVVF